MLTTSPDVVVIGGGPAGSTIATLIAQAGRRVVLFERERFPRFHIGESLIPETYWVLQRLNMLAKLRGSRNVKKYSVQFVSESGKLSAPFYFWDHKPQESSQTWQVFRQEFDQLMLENAREHGVEVHEGARVLEILFDGSRATGVRVRLEDGSEQTVHCPVVADASGQSSMILDRLGLREWDPKLKKAAVWTYWEGAWRGPGQDEGATLVVQIQGKKGWFWYIPLHDNRVSVGAVADAEYLLKRDTKDPEAIYFQEVEKCPGIKERIAPGKRCAGFRIAKEYSYRSKQAAGDGWVTVGDAYGFLDPLYSSGVLLALKSGQMAADAVVEGLARGDTSASQLGKWESDFATGMDRMRRLVVAFYEGFNFGKFVRRYPQLKGYLTDLLIGDLFDPKVDVVWPLIDEIRAEAGAETRAELVKS
jgi:flavin-dependent dehydrogenase